MTGSASGPTSSPVRWTVLLLPLVLPWVLVTWSDGWYVVFAAFWVDPGPRVVTLFTFLSQTTIEPGSGSFVWSWPLALVLYGLGLAVALARPQRPVLSGSLLWLAGLAVGFFAIGLSGQQGILAIPIGLIVFWSAAGYEVWRHLTDQ